MSLVIEDRQALVSLAVDTYKNKVNTKYSVDEIQSAMRNALIKANNNKTSLDIRDLRDGKCKEIFSIIEEILAETEYVGLEANPLFKEIVEYKSNRLGDKNSFYVQDSSDFYVSHIAEGTQALIRQRITGGREISVDVNKYGIKIYEELDRLLSGRVDFNELINKAIKSFDKCRYELILGTFLKLATTNPLNVISVTANSYNENQLMDLCLDVEYSNNGVQPIILGTKKALRNITLDPTVLAEQGKIDRYETGYYGKFNGYTCVALPQTLKKNTLEKYLPDNVLYVIGTLNDKPVKFFTEGEPFVIMGDPTSNADLSQDWLMTERFGASIILAGKKNGIYTIA